MNTLSLRRQSAELTAYLDDQARRQALARDAYLYRFTEFEEFTPEEQAANLARTLQAGQAYRQQKASLHAAACQRFRQQHQAQTHPVGAHSRAPGKETQ